MRIRKRVGLNEGRGLDAFVRLFDMDTPKVMRNTLKSCSSPVRRWSASLSLMVRRLRKIYILLLTG